MKGIERDIMFAIGILLIGLIFLVVFLEKLGTDLWKTNFDEKALQAQVDNQEKELKEMYNSYSKNDGGFDAYEASILVAKVIEYTWRDCYNICDDEKELFTGFFVKYPINFVKDMDCSSYPRSSGDKIYPDIRLIKGMCSLTDIGTDKTKKVDEWTVTAWGLANTTMCSNYKLSSKEDSKQWGNGVCDGDASTTGKKCADFCDRSKDVDKIDWQGGIMNKGNKYSNIRIAYNPDTNWNPLTEEPKIIVKEIS